MVSMKSTKSKKKNDTMWDDSEYPYGIRIYLNKEELKKLGLENKSEVNEKVSFSIITEITSIEVNEKDKSISFQITDMEVKEPESNPAEILYKKG